MPRKRIFVSHISNEADLAQGVKRLLEKHFLGMLEIFVSSDRETIQAGQKWLLEVDKALRSADMQIVLCSKESVARPWVNFEAGAVWLRGIPVIPLCHSGMTPNDLPVPLGMLEGIQCGRPEGMRKLYDAIAALLKVNAPDVDFAAVAAELKSIEDEYVKSRQGMPTIENPRVLCAASAQYAGPGMGFELDVAVLRKAFPGRVDVEDSLTGPRLMALLTSQRYDIVHLVIAVDRDRGDLIFSPIDLASPAFRHPDETADIMTPQAFAALLTETQAKLVVLATCKALLLAVEVANVSNMAATDASISGEQAAHWEACFYGLLAQGVPLYKAFDLTRLQSDTPIRAVRQRDLRFKLSAEARAGN